jgi:dethiobiotin synthetase/adenosylmethionine--8-amino-7-oxononanoate aminotransferase
MKYICMNRVCCTGTVFAAEIKPQQGATAGYASNDAKSIVQWLRRSGVYARPLGNVVYLLVTPTTRPSQSHKLLETVLRGLDDSKMS